MRRAITGGNVVLNMLSSAVFTRLGRMHRGRMVGVMPANEKLRGRVARVIADLADLPLDEARGRLEEADGNVEAELAAKRRS